MAQVLTWTNQRLLHSDHEKEALSSTWSLEAGEFHEKKSCPNIKPSEDRGDAPGKVPEYSRSCAQLLLKRFILSLFPRACGHLVLLHSLARAYGHLCSALGILLHLGTLEFSWSSYLNRTLTLCESNLPFPSYYTYSCVENPQYCGLDTVYPQRSVCQRLGYQPVPLRGGGTFCR